MRRIVSGSFALAALLAPAQEPAGDAAPLPVAGLVRGMWIEARAELWLLCEGGARVRVFDPWLREHEGRAAAEMPPGGTAPAPDGACEVPLWSGRVLRADAAGRLEILPTWWETAPRLQWGPGWAAVELRNAQPLAALWWRRSGDAELRPVPFACDRFDGAAQRAVLHGLEPGERIEIALPPLRPEFPPRAAPSWEAFTVPAVAPDGARPTSEWPRG